MPKEKVIIHPFTNHRLKGLVGDVEAYDVWVGPAPNGDDSKKKVVFKIRWNEKRHSRGPFMAFVPKDWYEFCLLVDDSEPITFAHAGLHPAKEGNPLLIMASYWAVTTLEDPNPRWTDYAKWVLEEDW